jgi:shikimate kinase
MKNCLFLIGMSGAGKTTWGKKLALAYRIRHIDIDEYIEVLEATSISRIFALKGESTFRKIESLALKTIVSQSKEKLIISCGGGTPLAEENFLFMREHGCIVYLEAEIATLLVNLENGKDERPLLKTDVVNPDARLSELFEKRRKIYERADYKLIVEKLRIEDFKPILDQCIEPH